MSVRSGGVLPNNIQTAANKHGLLAMTFDPQIGGTTMTPAAATIILAKLAIPYSLTITNIVLNVATAGTSYTNTQVGLYNSSGTYLASSAVMASAGTNTLGSLGDKVIALDVAQAITGGPTTFVWIGFHMGTNNATAVKLICTNTSQAGGAAAAGAANFNLAASTAAIATQTGHATNNLATIGNLTPGSATLVGSLPLFGVT